MTAQNIKSRTITNLDASPIVYDTAGFNIAAREVVASDFCTVTTGGLADTTSTYKILRVRSNVKLTSLSMFVSTALDTGGGSASLTWDVGAYYSDSTTDGTQSQLQGTLISATALGSAIVSPATAKLPGKVEVLPYAPANMDEMLWEFLALASDPGGYIDIVLAVHAAANTGAAGDVGLLARYSEG